MPTNKTPFTFNIKDEYLEKMRYIAERETRSLSNLLEHLCKLYIEEYEQNNGEIKDRLEVISDIRHKGVGGQ